VLWLARVRRRAVVPVPSTWTMRRRPARRTESGAARIRRATVLPWTGRHLESQLAGQDLVVLGQPNNPRAACSIASVPDAGGTPSGRHVVVNEALPTSSTVTVRCEQRAENVVVMRSFTKFTPSGLRSDSAWRVPILAERIRRQIAPWSVNTLAQEAALGLLPMKTTPGGRSPW